MTSTMSGYKVRADAYNGYTNYETFLVIAWLEGDESLYHQAHEIATRWPVPCQGMHYFVASQNHLTPLSTRDKDSWGENMSNDLLKAALQNVEWGEVVESLTE
jgi:hypothetical protein